MHLGCAKMRERHFPVFVVFVVVVIGLSGTARISSSPSKQPSQGKTQMGSEAMQMSPNEERGGRIGGCGYIWHLMRGSEPSGQSYHV